MWSVSDHRLDLVSGTRCADSIDSVVTSIAFCKRKCSLTLHGSLMKTAQMKILNSISVSLFQDEKETQNFIRDVLVLLKFGHFHVNSKQLGVQGPQKVEFE